MKNTMKKIGLLFAVIIMTVLCAVSVSALEPSGRCGDNVYWTFDENAGELVISGEGEMWDYSYRTPFSDGNIKNVVIEDGVTSIGDGAFYNCMLIKSISIPASLESIGKEVFMSTAFLKEIILDEKNQYFVVEDGVLFNKYKTTLIMYPPNKDGTTYTVPNTVETIGEYAFAFCLKLEKINIPDSVKHIDFGAFAYSRSLKEINLPIYIEDQYMRGVFWHCIRLEKLIFPNNLEHIHYEAFQWSVSLEEINLPESLTYLEGVAMLPSLKELIVPGKVEEVCWIEDCFALEKIVLPESVKKLSDVSVHYLKDLYVYNKDLVFEDVNLKAISNITKEDLIKAHNDAMFVDFDVTEENFNDDALTALQDELWDKYYELFRSAEYVTSQELTIHGYKDSTAEAYAKENGIKFEEIKEVETVTKTDDKTGVQTVYDSDVFDTDVQFVIEENGSNIIFSEEYENYKSYDISFFADGKKVQPNGKVTVKLPVPADFNAETIAVYYVDDKDNKTRLNSKIENGYAVFETDHFSEYVIVDESSKIEEPTEPEVPVDPTPDEPDGPEDTETLAPCSCKCHAGGIKAFFFKLFNFFAKLFNPAKRVCACGVKH